MLLKPKFWFKGRSTKWSKSIVWSNIASKYKLIHIAGDTIIDDKWKAEDVSLDQLKSFSLIMNIHHVTIF